MKYSGFSEEKKLWSQGYEFVVGLDEAGRGPLAGPVVASAVMLVKNFKPKEIKIRDSKKMSQKQREFFYEKLTNNNNIKWRIGVVSEKIIDKINILEATKLAMQKAVEGLNGDVSFLILDGNFTLKNININQRAIISADAKVFSCTAAGIIAKVFRDRIMHDMHKRYPEYGFDKHKGYGTKLHIDRIIGFGISPIHRKSFEPVRSIYKKQFI